MSHHEHVKRTRLLGDDLAPFVVFFAADLAAVGLVLVTIGIRSTSAALIAGLSFAFIPEVFATYLPTSWGEVPPALFGLGNF